MRALLITLVLAGCASSLDQMRRVGADLFGCPVEDVTARELRPQEYQVEGCGKRAHYSCKLQPDGTILCPKDVAVEPIPGETEIRVAKDEPPAGCKELGPVEVVDKDEYQRLYSSFRERVKKLGGNYGRIDAMGKTDWNQGFLRGVAFRCPEATSRIP